MHSSCLCGSVRWDAGERPLSLSHCHCSRCRKAHGTAFETTAMTPAAGFRLGGVEHVAVWESSPGFARRFCRRCGSVVPAQPDGPMAFLPAGNLDGDPGVRPALHIFVASKAPWYEIPDALPRFDAYPPGIGGTILADRPHDHTGDAIHGSCNCGAVAFEYDGEPIVARHCHCSRCRKGRSAAHASNLIVPHGRFRFTRGVEHTVSYKVPDAKSFTQVFCAACGGKLPRVAPGRGIAVIPMGALDDDPGVRPREHIFTASKAPWFEILDALPQYPEGAP
jgi:hypothetical protein